MHLFDLPASWQVSKYLKTSIKTYYNMNNKDRYIWKTRRRRRRILSYDVKDIKCINEFMYQGLENSIQLELGTLQQDVMRSRASSLSTILTSSNIRRDDADDDDYDDVIGRDKHNNKRINENTVLTYISSSKTLLSFYCIDVKYDIVKIVLYV
jgi:hypothetical protein